MSATGRRRIEKIEESLTPRQAVVLWLEEAAQLGSLRDYVLSIKDGPDAAFPLFRLSHQVEQAVRGAVLDVAFLFHLVLQINGRELTDRRGNCLHLMLVIERLHSFLRDEPLEGHRHEQWLEFVTTLAGRLYALARAADLSAGSTWAGARRCCRTRTTTSAHSSTNWKA